jgi:D-alanyl-D-alanine carboxypeptidase
VLTAIVVDEHIYDWNQDVRISQKAAFSGGAAIHLKWDEIIKAENLLKAMLMNSDNGAAIALAEHVSGSTEEFSKLMNQKAKELGALDSHFEESSGLEDERSYSSAYDFAKITQALLKNERLVKIMQTKGPIEVNSCDGLLSHRVGNTNLFLKDEKTASKVIANKTGFTYNAGYCLMTSFWDDSKKRKVIGVILNGEETMRWEEMKEIFNWSFKNYKW